MSRRLPDSIRQQVRERAGRRCEYCLKLDNNGIDLYEHHVDHIRPIVHGDLSELDNLAWACFQCNSAKSGQIASYDPKTDELTLLFNPRTQNWNQHFRFNSAEIIRITPVGRVTLRILQMNDPAQIDLRQAMMRAKRW